MELASPINNIRTNLVIVFTGLPKITGWNHHSHLFLKKILKTGIHVTVVGPKPTQKIGSKKNLKILDRHDVISLKQLEASRSHKLEMRILSTKNKSWFRIRTEACITVGSQGIWPECYDGWVAPGTLSLDALLRWVYEYKIIPGHEFIFIGSSNLVFQTAITLMSRGVKKCYIVEPSSSSKAWRSYQDTFVSKGGRLFSNHQVSRVEQTENTIKEIYLKNDKGTMILSVDTVVLCPVNDDALNTPEQWKNGLFYLQTRKNYLPNVKDCEDEEFWLEKADWDELFWRVSRWLLKSTYALADGSIKNIKSEKKQWLDYRKNRQELTYSGKILDGKTLSWIQSSHSVPHSINAKKPKASLECFEKLPCRACESVCPESAIRMQDLHQMPELLEDKCTGCGACVSVCPSGAAVMLKTGTDEHKVNYYFSDQSKNFWKTGQDIQLLNRKGESLGMGRVVSSQSYEAGSHRVLEVEASNVYLWDARGYRKHQTFNQSEEQQSLLSKVEIKRSWVELNGVQRLCPVDVPVTVSLWKLGQRRFEDALFCSDGSCKLCEVLIDGKKVLACQAILKEGQQLKFKSIQSALQQPLCYCKQIEFDAYLAEIENGSSEKLVQECTGVGYGQCHGKWCLSSLRLNSNINNDSLRPRFAGYEISPWRGLWAKEVVDSEGSNE